MSANRDTPTKCVHTPVVEGVSSAEFADGRRIEAREQAKIFGVYKSVVAIDLRNSVHSSASSKGVCHDVSFSS